MWDDRTTTKRFNSVANHNHLLNVTQGVDGDLWIMTEPDYRNIESVTDDAVPTCIRVRTYAGGGIHADPEASLYAVLIHLFVNGEQIKKNEQHSFIHELTPFKQPKQSRVYYVRCDDNPGSAMKIIISKDFIGFQTYTFDEDKNSACGAMCSINGYGPIVWLNKYQLGISDKMIRKFFKQNFVNRLGQLYEKEYSIAA